MMVTEDEAKPTDVDGEADDTAETSEEASKSPPTAETGSPSAATEAPSVSAEDSGTVSAAAKPPPAPRVVIVTGASSGLGFAVSKMLCAGKHDVILACRSEQKATRAIAKIRKQHPDASATYMQVGESKLDDVTFSRNEAHVVSLTAEGCQSAGGNVETGEASALRLRPLSVACR